MKKIICLITFICFLFIAKAQIQRELPASLDSAENKLPKKNIIGSKKNIMAELNLTKDQKLKIKEIKESGRDKIDEIETNEKITEVEKNKQIKEFKKLQFQKIMNELNDQQKKQLMQLRKEKQIGEKMDN